MPIKQHSGVTIPQRDGNLGLVQRTAAEILAAITPDKSLPPEGGG